MSNSEFTANTIEASVRLGLLLLLATWCFNIITPFIVPVVWGVIIAVAIYPLFTKLKSLLGDRNKLAATVYTLFMLALLITPTVMISNSIIDSSSVTGSTVRPRSIGPYHPSEDIHDLLA